jgi:secretory phospholipase A2
MPKKARYLGTTIFYDKYRSCLALVPGSLWCGQGDGAASVRDLGGHAGLDRCCRHHDLACPQMPIDPGETRDGLTNTRHFKAFHCSCDLRFRNCLKLENSDVSNMVGRMFFEVVNTPCYDWGEEDVCLGRTWWGRCKGYGQQSRLRWVDLYWR